MRKNLFVLIALAALLSPLALAQGPGIGPGAGYLQWPASAQPNNIPAGTVVDPGSHLTYIVDTGINARAIAGKADLSGVAEAAKTPLVSELTKGRLDPDGDGVFNPGTMYQNFISITNTNPTMSVTVHFRYFNDNCKDLLDFLVVVTCNDTLLFDPFDFVIPFTNGENTSNRLIGPAGDILEPILVNQWGSGRFVITAAASGTTVDNDIDADILFPFEWRGLDTTEDDCNMNFTTNGTFPVQGTPLLNTLFGTIPNVGVQQGLRSNNLHVFNASQISFDYLIGFITTAVPANFAWGSGAIQNYSVNAWTRPSVMRSGDVPNPVTGLGDGNGPQVQTGFLLLGNELVSLSDGSQGSATNPYYLRNDVHGGDIQEAVLPVGANGGYSRYGALGTLAFFPTEQDQQAINFLSANDDYNGSNNASDFGSNDHSANIGAAVTTYILQVYDSDEDLLTFEIPPEVVVSPPIQQSEVVLKITCYCLRTYFDFEQNGLIKFSGSTSVDVLPLGKGADQTGALELDDLNYFSSQVFTGLGDFDGLLQTVAIQTGDDFVSEDLSGGWIRFVRDNTVQVLDIPADAGTAHTNADASGPGTATIDQDVMADEVTGGPSFITIGLQILKFEGYGASWYLHTVASDAHISEIGAETY